MASQVPWASSQHRMRACSVAKSCPILWHYVACQAPLSMGFSRQECWSRSKGLPNLGIEPTSPVAPALAGRFFTTGKPFTHGSGVQKWVHRVGEDRKRGAETDRHTHTHTHSHTQTKKQRQIQREGEKKGREKETKRQRNRRTGRERENLVEAYPFYEKLHGEPLCPFLFIKIKSLQRRNMWLPLHAESKKERRQMNLFME